MDKVVELLHSKGLKATAQRVAVYNALKQKGHASAEEVFDMISSTLPMLSLATVYATLRLFCREGLAEEMAIYNDKAYFDIRKPFHHHFVCESCGKVMDAEIEFCDILKKKLFGNNKILRFSGVFYGICEECINKEGGHHAEGKDGKGAE